MRLKNTIAELLVWYNFKNQRMKFSVQDNLKLHFILK